MLPLSTLRQHSMLYGMLLSAILSIIILGTLFIRPQIWLDRAPGAIRAAAGPTSPRDRKLKRLPGIPTILMVVGLLVHALQRLISLGGGHLTFLITQVWNLVDLILIDWLVVERIRPRFMIIPGTEHLRSYRDYGIHFRGFLKGMVGSFIASLMIGGMAVGMVGMLS